MKYIRTKDDKIYYMGDLDKSEILNRKPFVHRKTQKLIYPTYIKQEADTIEELCDGYVEIDKNGIRKIQQIRLCNGVRIVPKHGIQYYGAVWADEGLIFVAKMNKKGELELL